MPSRNPRRHDGYRSSQPNSRLAFALEAPRRLVIIVTGLAALHREGGGLRRVEQRRPCRSGYPCERRLECRAFEVSDPVKRTPDLGRRIVVERVVLRLHPGAPAGVHPRREALRDEPAHASGRGRGDQVVRALRAQAVRLCERLIEAPRVELRRDRRQLVDDHVWLGLEDCSGDGLSGLSESW